MTRRALVADPAVAVAATIKRYLESSGFSVKVVRFVDEAVLAVKEAEPEILFAAVSPMFDGEALCQKVKEASPGCSVVLVYPPEADDPDSQAARCGADAYLVAPLKRGTVTSCTKMVSRIRTLHETVGRLEEDLKRHVAEPPADPFRGAGSSADFEFFKKFLLMEVKRSRRYKYPVSFLLIGLDHFENKARDLDADKRNAAQGEALTILTRGIRDIDLAVPFSEGRYLVFLPHTPRTGALVVAARARERLAKMQSLAQVTASAGVASYEPSPSDAPLSFGQLLKQATELLRKAQLAGGDRVEGGGEKPAKRDRISLG